MTNHKNLKKVLTVSTMAAATMGASALVNADNIQPSSVSSQTSSVASVSSASQVAKSSSTVALKSSQSSKATTQSSKSSAVQNVASSKANDSTTKVSSTKQQARSIDGKTKVTPSMSDEEYNKLQNEINNASDIIEKYKDDTSFSVETASDDMGGEVVMSALNGYTSGLDTVDNLRSDINRVKNIVNNDKQLLATETNEHAKEIIQAQLTRDQDALAFLENALNKMNGTDTTQSMDSSTQETTSKSSSNEDNGKASSSSKTSDKKAETKVTDKNAVSAKHSAVTKKNDVKSTNNKVATMAKSQTVTDNKNDKVTTVVKAKASSKKATKASSTKAKDTMPQTGEQTKDASILVAVGTIAIAAAGALLMRKHH